MTRFAFQCAAATAYFSSSCGDAQSNTPHKEEKVAEIEVVSHKRFMIKGGAQRAFQFQYIEIEKTQRCDFVDKM